MRGRLGVLLQDWKRNTRDGRGNRPQESAEEPPWLAQLDREGIPRSLHYPTTTLDRILQQTADRFGDVPAVVYDSTQYTYRELREHVERMAIGLTRRGLRAGDRVLLTLPNCPEYIFSFFATQTCGALLVNAGPLLGADGLRHLIALTQPRIAIGLDLQAEKLLSAARDSSVELFVWVSLAPYQAPLYRLGYRLRRWQARPRGPATGAQAAVATLVAATPTQAPDSPATPDAVAVLQPTSGTTGALKLAELSHRNLLANATQVAVCLGARQGQERVLALLPMFHSYGMTLGLTAPVLSGATIILMTRFDATQALDALERARPTVFPLVPAICDALVREITRRPRRLTLSELRCISGAAPLPFDCARKFEQLTGARVVEGYGLSECSPVTHTNPLLRPRYGTIGLPLPDTHCRIVDLETGEREVPAGEAGELLLAGPQVMRGYYQNAEETRLAFRIDPEGCAWLRTGDVVRMDADGYFQILDRKKDMIIRSGLKVYPGKVEALLKMHTDVADAAVIGRADPVHTEEVVAVIAPRATAVSPEVLAADLRALCRAHLAAYEVPSTFEFTAQIPRSALGKVLKRELRRLFAVPRPAVPERQVA
ncbi:MAG TPA: AMP-binding protein [Candidatus Sulfotelmatobacter sp.]|nr:AMP-binding protein [Candidatus Sulfotelmatobacter sp.]